MVSERSEESECRERSGRLPLEKLNRGSARYCGRILGEGENVTDMPCRYKDVQKQTNYDRIPRMRNEDLKEIKEKLISEKTKIERNLSKLKEELDFGDDVDHNEEETDETEEMGTYLSVKKTQDARLQQINKAIEKIKNGAYGLCEKCGGPIEQRILDIDPESFYCKECKRGL